MTAFPADWLALREPADAAARSTRIVSLAADRLDNHETVQVLDLAAGTGANMRYLAGRLPRSQRWVLADHDAVLLRQAPLDIQSWAESRGFHSTQLAESLELQGHRLTCRVRFMEADLARSLDPGIFAGSNLVTASALLDLVSERWLRNLTTRCREAGAVVLFALSYDGRIACEPNERDDDAVRSLVNAHQLTDKGFGDALGPAAVEAADRSLTDAGYRTVREASDWALGPEHHALQRQLIEGWAQAAVAIAPAQTSTIQDWRSRRLAHVDAGRSQLTVGHQDLVGWLASSMSAEHRNPLVAPTK